MLRWAWIFALGYVFAVPQSAAGSNAEACGVARLALCSDTNALMRDGNFDRALDRFLGKLSLSRISLFYPSGVLVDQIVEALNGPPDPPKRLPSGGFLFTACRLHSCDEKGAIAFDKSGRLVAIGILSFRCSTKCAPNAALDVFLRQEYPDAEEAHLAIQQWAKGIVNPPAQHGYARALGAEQLQVLDKPEPSIDGDSVPVTLDELHRVPATYAGNGCVLPASWISAGYTKLAVSVRSRPHQIIKCDRCAWQ